MIQSPAAAGRSGVRALAPSVAAQLVLLLAFHALLWTWVGWSSRSNFDAPGDMVEAYAWAQGWQWGYYKHPPLAAWVAGLWFSVVPESHLGYSLLAALNGALGLAGLALLARETLPRPWVLLVVAVASLAPGITTLAMRFNCNAILVSTWPWALALFVRLMRHGRTRDAVGCGLACAAAMLGKYYSGVLVFAMLATAALLPAWRARLFSRPFLLAVLCFIAALAPHAAWLLAQTQGPLQYAQAATGQQGAGESVARALSFALAQCVFPLLAFLVLRLALRGPARNAAFWQAASAALRPRLNAPWLLAMLPILATMLATVALHARTATVWGLALAGTLSWLAVTRAREAGAALSTARLWRVLAVVWALVALFAPAWWTVRAKLEVPAVAEPREELAEAVSLAWRDGFGTPLPWVSGTRALAASVSFYADGHPRYWSLWNQSVETPWTDSGRVMADGGAIVCDAGDDDCRRLAESWSARHETISVAKQARGFRFAARQYEVYWIAPLPAAQVP